MAVTLEPLEALCSAVAMTGNRVGPCSTANHLPAQRRGVATRGWEELRLAAIRLLASADAPPDPVSKAITRRQAEEVANEIADWLVANGYFPTDWPEGHRLARQLAAVAGTEEDIANKLRPVT